MHLYPDHLQQSTQSYLGIIPYYYTRLHLFSNHIKKVCWKLKKSHIPTYLIEQFCIEGTTVVAYKRVQQGKCAQLQRTLIFSKEWT